MDKRSAPTLYFSSKTGKWGTTPIEGAPTWQHSSMMVYEAWLRSQDRRRRYAAQRAADRRRTKAQSKYIVERCLMALLAHWERS